MLLVVLGPQTRLAGTLLSSSSWGSGTTFVLVARNVEESEILTLAQPDAVVFRAWKPESCLPEEAEAVVVLCCALGMIHPGTGAASPDLGGADYRTLETVLRRYSNLPLHLVLISSVLALCPRAGREYYAGSKNVFQALVRQLADSSTRILLSVFYPGRLVEMKKAGRPTSFLHTSYRELTEEIVSTVRRNRSREVILGLDSRLLLIRRCFSLLWSVLSGRR